MTQRMDRAEAAMQRMTQDMTDMAGKLEVNDQGVKTTIDAAVRGLSERVNAFGSDVEDQRARMGHESMRMGDHHNQMEVGSEERWQP